MTARENALRIVRFDRPEYVMTGLPCHGIGYRGVNHEGYAGGGHECPIGTRWTDVWGTTWEKKQEGVMGFPVRHPISDEASLRAYRWPDPDDERICGGIYTLARDFAGSDVFLGGRHRDTLWEKAYMLVGMENLMIYFHTEPGFAREVLHRIMDFQMGIARHYLKAGIEYAALGDDLGTQLGPLISPRAVQDFLVPEYRRLFDLYRQRGVLIEFHSCGRIDWMIETFMRLGVDILNPVQATANDLVKVRAMTQGRMALAGAVSSAIIMDGPVERIRRAACERIWQLAQSGGYFCRADQGLPFPPDHAVALAEAVEQYGRYPLQPPAHAGSPEQMPRV